ncbi:MAG TPA: CUAEP/CCAEP-tail radical SAM protein [Candidatus Dormibacteraeota bacterium]|nr:CUAEP/CCAEP-tail radical SAM protein [Candidatus Dormibacteraeota bacterium]
MRVLLVSCYELGHQPLHVASPAAFLRAAGHEVRARDLAVERLDDASVDWAEMIGVAVPMHTAMRLASQVVERVRRRRGQGTVIAAYGLYAPLCVDSLPGGMIDHAVGGEYEEELVRIAGGTPSGRTIVLDRLRFPPAARDLLPPLERYARLLVDGEERLAATVDATRGCVHRCRHCPVPAVYDGRIRVVGRDALLADVAQLHRMGARHLSYGDPDFLNAVPHALATARAVHAAFADLTFDVTAKVEHILENPGIWAELVSLGLLFVVSAVESLSPTVLDILGKGHAPDDARRAIALLRAHGIEMRPSLLPFTPWSTLPDYLELLDLVRDGDLVENVDPVQLSIRLLLPEGSLLLDHPQMGPHLTGFDPKSFSHRWRHPDPAMDRLQADVAALVAADADAGVAPAETHARIRRLAAAAAACSGIRWDPAAPRAVLTGRPRLSEPWFCCAEPTERQLGAV